MAVDISYIYNFIKNTCFGYLGKTLKSTLWTSILIVILILIILLFLYPCENDRTFIKVMKPIIYIFISTLLIIFIHDSYLKDVSKKIQEDISSENIIGGIKLHQQKDKESNIYDVVYGKGEHEVKTRSHESIGNNSFVAAKQTINVNEAPVPVGGDETPAIAIVGNAFVGDASPDKNVKNSPISPNDVLSFHKNNSLNNSNNDKFDDDKNFNIVNIS